MLLAYKVIIKVVGVPMRLKVIPTATIKDSPTPMIFKVVISVTQFSLHC